jgi:uncharacterized protein (TIGR00106 family)
MLVELSIVPLGCDVRWSDQLAEALKLVDASGLPYLLTPSGTCIEGEWDEVMALVRRCHDLVRRSSPHVPTSVRIEDVMAAYDRLQEAVGGEPVTDKSWNSSGPGRSRGRRPRPLRIEVTETSP